MIKKSTPIGYSSTTIEEALYERVPVAIYATIKLIILRNNKKILMQGQMCTLCR